MWLVLSPCKFTNDIVLTQELSWVRVTHIAALRRRKKIIPEINELQLILPETLTLTPPGLVADGHGGKGCEIREDGHKG